MKSWKTLFAVVGAVVFVASAILLCLAYRDKIKNFFGAVKGKCCIKKAFTSEEYSDFADI